MWAQVALAYILDLAIGDPIGTAHPVVLMGRLIKFLENILYTEKSSNMQRKFLGMVLAAIVIGISASITWGIVYIANLVNIWVGFIISVLLISTTIATKGLMDSAKSVAEALKKGDLKEARERVSHIVGRDTENMKRREVVRATIETVAENAVDGVIAPIVYAVIGGAPLAMAYKAVNTLDSMIGYKNERYEDFGWAGARLDDVANYIPARISVLLLAISAFLIRKNPLKAIRIAIRDGKKHASPNSGLPEAAVAGIFNIRLGGTNIYGGIKRKTGFLGDGKGALTERNINDVVWLVFITSTMTVLLSRAVIFAIGFIQGR